MVQKFRGKDYRENFKCSSIIQHLFFIPHLDVSYSQQQEHVYTVLNGKNNVQVHIYLLLRSLKDLDGFLTHLCISKPDNTNVTKENASYFQSSLSRVLKTILSTFLLIVHVS